MSLSPYSHEPLSTPARPLKLKKKKSSTHSDLQCNKNNKKKMAEVLPLKTN